MRKWIIIVVIILVVVGGGFVFIQSRGGLAALTSNAKSDAAATPLPAIQNSPSVIVNAIVVPNRYATLSLSASGTVADVLVKEGDRVNAGQLIAQLDNQRQVIAIAQAEANVRSARAHLGELKAGSRPEEIAQTQAAVDTANANLLNLKEGSRPGDIAAAQANLAAAEANLKQILAGADQADIINALVDLSNAEASLRQAQSAYDQVKSHSDIGALPQSAELRRATNNYEAAKARYDTVVAGAKQNAIASAHAQVEQARAALEKVMAPATESEIAAAEAQVRQAEADLALRKAGARAETIAAAEADLTQAQTALMQRQLELADTELHAPFTGTVASLNLETGEQVVAGSPVAQLADLTDWRIETDDLTEINVVYVHVGDRVQISIDALPDLQMEGTVERVKPLGEKKQGDITYTATIKPDTVDPRFRWQMSASVTIKTQE